MSSPTHSDPVTIHVPPVTGHVGWTAGIAVRGGLLDLGVPQGGFRIRVTDGTNRYCARFDAASVVVDVPGHFAARGASSAALSDCSAASLGEPATSPCAVEADTLTCGGACRSDEACTFDAGARTCSCRGRTGLACGGSGPVCQRLLPGGLALRGHHAGRHLRAELRLRARRHDCVRRFRVPDLRRDVPGSGDGVPAADRVPIAGDPGAGMQLLAARRMLRPSGFPGLDACGPGADCPPGSVCDRTFTLAVGCIASCVTP